MKSISILGSTGSIGQNTLEIVKRFPDQFQVIGLAAKSNINVLEEQVRHFRPEVVALEDPVKAECLKDRLGGLASEGGPRIEVIPGAEGMARVASHCKADIVVSAMVGAAGLVPTLEAVRAKKRILLANKEILVMAGEVFMAEARRMGIQMIPVDSEHSAIFQCLEGRKKQEIYKIILTASGGPFLNRDRQTLESVSVEEALKHPNWKMGKKITIDSATMMNKGFEMIEAYWLFDLASKQIDVVIHPQSIVHSMVEFIDGSVLAQLGIPDMKIPIQYALSYPLRLNGVSKRLNLPELETLSFKDMDRQKFPAVALAQAALMGGGTLPAVLNGANEVAVERFLEGQIHFTDISKLVRDVMMIHQTIKHPDLEQILEVDQWSRKAGFQWKAS